MPRIALSHHFKRIYEVFWSKICRPAVICCYIIPHIYSFVSYKCTNDESVGINEFLVPENICLDTKINFLWPLLRKLWHTYGRQNWRKAAILFFGRKKNSSRVPRWHPADSCSGHVKVPESTIKHHTYLTLHLTQFYPFGYWTICCKP